jgi:hypothetical protein
MATTTTASMISTLRFSAARIVSMCPPLPHKR